LKTLSRRDGGTNFILRIKEQEKRLTLQEHDDDDDDDEDDQFTLHLSKDQPEDGPTNRAETCRWNYNLM